MKGRRKEMNDEKKENEEDTEKQEGEEKREWRGNEKDGAASSGVDADYK